MSASIDLAIAVGVISGEAVIDSMTEEARRHRAVRHPYLEGLIEGRFSDLLAVLQDFAHQYGAFRQAHEAAVQGAMAQISNERHRTMLETLLRPSDQENWNRFVDALDLHDTSLYPACEEVRIWTQLFVQTSNSGGAGQAIGAMGPGTAAIRAEVHWAIDTAAREHLSLSPEVLGYFAPSSQKPKPAWKRVAADLALSPALRPQLRAGMLMALNLRAALFDTLLRRAESAAWQQEI